MSKALTIMINMIVITIVMSQMDPYGNQLAQEYIGLYVAAGLLALLTLDLLISFIDEHILGYDEEDEEEQEPPFNPIMPELRRRDYRSTKLDALNLKD